MNVICVTDKGNSNVVHLHLGNKADVFLVLVGESSQRESTSLTINALAAAQLTTGNHGGVDFSTLRFFHTQANEPIVQQQHVTGLDILRDPGVTDKDSFLVTRIASPVGIENKATPRFQADASLGKFADADFRTLQIRQYADIPAQIRQRIANPPTINLILGRAPSLVAKALRWRARWTRPRSHSSKIRWRMTRCNAHSR